MKLSKNEKGLEKSKTFQKSDKNDSTWNLRFLFGAVVVVVGVGLLLQNVFPWFSFNYAWPFIIIAVGLYLLKGRTK